MPEFSKNISCSTFFLCNDLTLPKSFWKAVLNHLENKIEDVSQNQYLNSDCRDHLLTKLNIYKNYEMNLYLR